MPCTALLFQNYRFCPGCGASLKKEYAPNGEVESLVCTTCANSLYPDPKVVACVIVNIHGRLLLVRRKRRDDAQRWLLPGGYVNAHEQVEHAAQREIREETGLHIHLDGLVGVFSYPKGASVIIVYHSYLHTGHPYPNNEIKTLALFTPQELPWAQLAYTSSRDALQKYIQGQYCPMFP
ncbi:MAG: NUDIX domain-containing protein [Desulfomicrobium sp.]|jgi:ADP-ribose pyrophosphatase YjhB (NUDIX family)|nr:NUDIX domain-containing protein [Desulfomicrobium sp.]NLV96128.1 NUDIX domain-containing protein [Desulfovibrionales bacterium]